jgi:hypothetical protein
MISASKRLCAVVSPLYILGSLLPSNAIAQTDPSQRLAPPYPAASTNFMSNTVRWNTSDRQNEIIGQFEIGSMSMVASHGYFQCHFRLLGPFTVEVWQIKSGNPIPVSFNTEPIFYGALSIFRIEHFARPQIIPLLGLSTASRPRLAFAKADVSRRLRDNEAVLEKTDETIAETIYRVGWDANYATWQNGGGYPQAQFIMLRDGDLCLGLGRSIPGNNSLAGTIRKLANRISWNST